MPNDLNKKKYQGIFDATPVSLWEEDFSAVKQFIEALRAEGVTDFRAHFDAHPEDVTRCIELVKINNINQATLNLYKATNEQELLGNLSSIFGVESFELFKEELILIANGAQLFQAEGINYTLDGEPLNVLIRWSVIPGFEQTLSHVIVSIFDITEQKKSEEQLKLQATALESVENAVVITNPDGEILWVNSAFTKLSGYSAAETIGRNPRFLKSGKNDEAFYQDLWRTISDGNIWECEELINRRKDGTLYYEHMVITPMKDENGRVLRYIAVKEDITERKQMEIQLRRQLQEEELLRRITAIPVDVYDLAHTFTDICKELATFFQAAAVSFSFLHTKIAWTEVLGAFVAPDLLADGLTIAPLPEIVPLDLLNCQQDFLHIPNIHTAPRFSLLQEKLASYDNRSALLVQVKSANDFQGLLVIESIKSSVFHAEDKEIIAKVVAHIEQMLRRVQAEQEAKKERDFSHQVMNNSGQGLIVLEPNWVLGYCNPAFGNLLGYDSSSLIGRPLTDLIQKDEFENMVPLTEDERQAGKSIREVNLLRASGEQVTVLMTAVPRVQNFETDGAICLITDLTAQKEIANALAHARDQAVEASRLKSEFLANMSHEIRTPLNAVIGMTSLLVDTDLTPDQLDFAQTIRSSGELLLGLVNDILDFSKVEAGKMELEKRPFSIRKCVEEAMDVVASKAADSGLELAIAIEPDVPHYIVGDVTRIRQVLVNLLNNGVKFTEKGEVVIRVKRYKTENKPTLGNNDDIVLNFLVCDTGIGISPEKMKRLFKSFSQVDASTTRKYGGTGLGLAISKQLVEMMGGEIWVESEQQQGSIFGFTLPTKVAAVKKQSPKAKYSTQLVGKRVLIVDDNETNGIILVKQTTSWGMHPHAVSSGKDALQVLAKGESFDLAVLDMQMPEMNGIMLAEEIRKQHPKQALPLVMLSSIGDRTDLKEASHFSAFLTKPVKQKLLLECLNNVLGETAVPTKTRKQTEQIDPETGLKNPLRILLAEDNLINQKVALRILQRMGYAADVAQNGVEALEKLQQKLYDVVLMDVQMPQMDGVEATQTIHEQLPVTEQPYIIALTANAMPGDREKFLAVGMDDYISKPIRIQDLTIALAKVSPLTAQ